eukprot:TRINITY_DN43405_c0_g1_i1.p1 TRINITY_DN43405_c0_g1~~TRINITY_DN43405_c0_g1_i1.p1  ORF type:complete len:1004 (+),score=217.85 TRINITY_DN43405_c0_g1_i1:45-3056(+)
MQALSRSRSRRRHRHQSRSSEATRRSAGLAALQAKRKTKRQNQKENSKPSPSSKQEPDSGDHKASRAKCASSSGFHKLSRANCASSVSGPAAEVTSLTRLYKEVLAERSKPRSPDGFPALHEYLRGQDYSEFLQLAKLVHRALYVHAQKIPGVNELRKLLSMAQRCVLLAMTDLAKQCRLVTSRDSRFQPLHQALRVLCTEMFQTNFAALDLKENILFVECQINRLDKILSSAKHAANKLTTRTGGKPRRDVQCTADVIDAGVLSTDDKALDPFLEYMHQQCSAALHEFDAWATLASGDKHVDATERTVRAASHALSQTAFNPSSGEDELVLLQQALSAAWTSIQEEHAFWVEGCLDGFPGWQLLAAGEKVKLSFQNVLSQLQELKVLQHSLIEELRQVELGLQPESSKGPARQNLQVAAERSLEAKYAVEDAERELRRARQRGQSLQGLDGKLRAARDVAAAADESLVAATTSLASLVTVFPEVELDFREGIPKDLLPIWVPQRTLGQFASRELIPGPSRNRVYHVKNCSGSFAVKEYAIAPGSLRTCWHEAAILRRAMHPNIVELAAVFEDTESNSFYLQFPFYKYGPIDQWMSAEKPGRAACSRVLHETLQAMAHLHSLDITHADVKPANILIGGDGHARLADFDVSVNAVTRTSTARLRATQTHVGYTPAFAAPELFQTGASPASDMFAFGGTVETLLEADDGSRDDFVAALKAPKPSRRPSSTRAMEHNFFKPLFVWQREEVRACCIMGSDLCNYGSREVKLEEGILCTSSEGHFTCKECLDKHVAAAVMAEMRVRRERAGCVYCPKYPQECQCQPYPDTYLARLVAVETFNQYNRSRISLLEEKKAHELEVLMQARLDAELRRLAKLDEEKRDVLVAVTHIREEILMLKCPRPDCRQAFVDFDGCLALKCSRCNCGFCGWCLKDCGTDAHEHVRSCRHKPRNADVYYATLDEFDVAMKDRQRELLQKYLQKLDSKTREAVKQDLGKELDHLLLKQVA